MLYCTGGTFYPCINLACMHTVRCYMYCTVLYWWYFLPLYQPSVHAYREVLYCTVLYCTGGTFVPCINLACMHTVRCYTVLYCTGGTFFPCINLACMHTVRCYTVLNWWYFLPLYQPSVHAYRAVLCCT